MDVILVNEDDQVIGAIEKIEAHRKALLHRAFSVFIFNKKGEILLHKRAESKYHSAGLWTNACCSHPQPGEDTLYSAIKRLKEEMGFTTILKKAFDFVYQSAFDNGLTEHEFDHVYIGEYEGEIIPNPEEVSEYQFLTIEATAERLKVHPEDFTVWFAIAFPKVEAYLKSTHK